MIINNEGVNSAEIHLNGELLVGTFNLNENVTEIVFSIELLKGENVLEIELRGKPGGQITIEFVKDSE